MSVFVKGFLMIVLLVLNACGYHLRGSLEVPESLKSVYLTGASSAFQDQITSILKASKGNLVTTSKEAGVVVKVNKEDIRNRVLSIGTTGKSTELELIYYIRFQFYDNHDKPLMDEQTIEISREFFNDQTAVLAKSSEEQLLRTEIYKQVARMVMARAKIALDNANTETTVKQ
jgi:LPS-assembly lipoprotein